MEKASPYGKKARSPEARARRAKKKKERHEANKALRSKIEANLKKD